MRGNREFQGAMFSDISLEARVPAAHPLRKLRADADADARLFKKAPGDKSRLCHMGHILMENRNGLIVDVEITHANGLAKTKLIGQAKLTGLALLCVATDNRVRMGPIGGWWDAHHA